MSTFIDNTQEVIDIRDIIERVVLLREELAGSDELAELEGILSELAGCGGDEEFEGEWYPITLIHDAHFEAAMDELLEDIGDIPRNLPSYLSITVDYDVLQADYSSVEIGNVTYWYR